MEETSCCFTFVTNIFYFAVSAVTAHCTVAHALLLVAASASVAVGLLLSILISQLLLLSLLLTALLPLLCCHCCSCCFLSMLSYMQGLQATMTTLN